MTREELLKRAQELRDEKKSIEDKEHKLYKDTAELEGEYLKTSIYPMYTVFTYAGNLVSLNKIACKDSGYRSYSYSLLYYFNLISSNGKTTNMILLRELTEDKIKEMIREKKLVLYDGDIEVKNDTDWPKEIHACEVKAHSEFKEGNRIYDYIIESKECENTRKKIKTYLTKYYRIQTESELRYNWYIKPKVNANEEGILETSFELYISRYNPNGKRMKERYSKTHVTKINEKDLFETLLDFS